MTEPRPDFLTELQRRGLFHQATHEEALRTHLSDPASSPRRGYAGFDPTSDSLTIGNLVPIVLLRRFQLAGHAPVVLVGGGTGLIGDPSGKSAERTLMTEEMVRSNVDSQRRIFGRVIDFGVKGAAAPLLVNNLDWLGKLSYLQALRDIGKHFSVNMMIQKDSVRERLNARDQGISYTEFSYMILQAYDFLHLWREHGVTLQMGGSDQWGNIVAGADLVRRMAGPEEIASRKSQIANENDGQGAAAFGVTAPLVTKSDGGKFGKTESGAVWLTADRTSPYAFYQFWLNAADDDAVRYLKIFSFISVEEIDQIAAAHASNPGAREAQRTLARHMTELLHGPTERERAEAAAQALFSGDIRQLPAETLREVLASAPTTTHSKSLLADPGVPLLDVLAGTSLASSKSQARQSLSEGSISVNGLKAAPDARLTTASLLHGSLIALRRGKKNWHVTQWE